MADKATPEQTKAAKVDHEIADFLARASVLASSIAEQLEQWERGLVAESARLYRMAYSDALAAVDNYRQALDAIDQAGAEAAAVVGRAEALARAGEAEGPFLPRSAQPPHRTALVAQPLYEWSREATRWLPEPETATAVAAEAAR
jgi:hypothetical protein